MHSEGKWCKRNLSMCRHHHRASGRMKYLAVVLIAGCGTTVNLHGHNPNLQSVNVGQPGCVKDCTLTHTATQGDGATGATVSNSDQRSTQLGGNQ